MEEQFSLVAGYVALGLEAVVVVIVAIGAIDAARALIGGVARSGWSAPLRTIWLRFAAWILLALEFALGADIVRTAIAPSWEDIGQLGAIAAIRTALGYFLGRDWTEVRETPNSADGARAEP